MTTDPSELYAVGAHQCEPLTVERVNDVLQQCLEHEMELHVPKVLLHPDDLPGAMSDGSVEIVRSTAVPPGQFLVVNEQQLTEVALTDPVAMLLRADIRIPGGDEGST